MPHSLFFHLVSALASTLFMVIQKPSIPYKKFRARDPSGGDMVRLESVMGSEGLGIKSKHFIGRNASKVPLAVKVRITVSRFCSIVIYIVKSFPPCASERSWRSELHRVYDACGS